MAGLFSIPIRNEWVLVAPKLHQHLVLSVFWILASLRNMYWYFHYFNLHFPSDIWYGVTFQMLVICISPLVRCLFKSLAHSLWDCLLLLSFKRLLYILDRSLILDMLVANVFLKSVLCHVFSFNSVICRAKFSILMKWRWLFLSRKDFLKFGFGL